MQPHTKTAIKNIYLLVIALVIYSIISILLFGKQTIFDLNNSLVRGAVNDSGAFAWFLNWLPYSYQHHLNYFLTNFIWYPQGFNLTHATFVPLLSFIALPITLNFGPIVSYNLLALASPALSALSAYILCKYITKSFSCSLLGGYFFGFSFYQVYFLSYADINITCIFLIPILVLLTLLYLDKKIKPISFIALTAITLTCQFLISLEIFMTYGIFAFILWLVAFKIYSDKRDALKKCGLLVLLSYVLSSILVSPYIYYFFKTPLPNQFMDHLISINSIASFIIPPKQALFHTKLFPGFGNHFRPGYLGLPAIAILIVFAADFWQTQKGKILLLAVLIPTIFSLGFGLEVYYAKDALPHYLLPLPGMLFHYLPIIHYAVPFRFIMYATLAIAVIMATWIAARKDFFRYTMVLISIAAILPTVQTNYWSQKDPTPPFISQGLYKNIIKKDDNVLILPFSYWGYDMLWQVKANMYFRQVGGFAGAFFPGKFSNDPMVFTMMYKNPITKETNTLLKQFITDNKIDHIIIADSVFNYWKTLMSSLNIKPVNSGGVVIYNINQNFKKAANNNL